MLEFLNKIRFLPVTIFTAALLLTVKIGSIWEGVDGYLNQGPLSVAPAAAQEAEEEPQEEGPAFGDADPGADPLADADGDEPMEINDPTLLSQAEIDLLQQLAERREALDAREREIGERGALLAAAESRIDKKIVELKDIRREIDGLIKKHDEQQENKVKSLVKVYSNMKPKDAARIFEDLEMDTLLMVAERMAERKLAPIMGKMNPVKAREITVELYRLRQLPGPEGISAE